MTMAKKLRLDFTPSQMGILLGLQMRLNAVDGENSSTAKAYAEMLSQVKPIDSLEESSTTDIEKASLTDTEIVALEEIADHFYQDGPNDNPFGQPERFDSHKDLRLALKSALKKLGRQRQILRERRTAK